MRKNPRLDIALVLSLMMVLGGYTDVLSDHITAIPRTVREKKIGPIEQGKPIPKEFLTCKPYYSDDVERSLAFFDNPADPYHTVHLLVTLVCIDHKREIAPCSPETQLVVSDVYLRKGPPFTTVGLPRDLTTQCKPRIPLVQWKTSKGIGIGDTLSKVLHIYGLPSTNLDELNKKSKEPFVIYYSKEKFTDIHQEFAFEIVDGVVTGIWLEEGEEPKF